MQRGSIWNAAAKRMVFAAGCAIAASRAVIIAATLVDFENLPAGTTVTTQYAAQGVVFGSAYLAADPNARSGTRVLRTVSPTAEVFKPIPLRMTFNQPQARVKLYATSPGVARNGTLTAFDAGGAVIAQDGPKLVAADRFTTMFEVTVRQAGIARTELQLEAASHYAIDDLEFDRPAAKEPGDLPRRNEVAERPRLPGPVVPVLVEVKRSPASCTVSVSAGAVGARRSAEHQRPDRDRTAAAMATDAKVP